MNIKCDFFKICSALIGKEVRVTLNNGVKYYGTLESYIPAGKEGNAYDEIYINSKGNIMGLLKSKVTYIEENI